MADSQCLAIDAMGGDFGPRVTVPATFDSLRQQPHLSVVLLGDESQIKAHFPADHASFSERVTILACDQVVDMDEKPSYSVRKKQQSSMWLAVQLVADRKADAVVSAGNTGAFMAMSLLQLGRIADVSRPAICSKVPSNTGHTYLLDMGANLECTGEQLYQFAQMANVVATAVDGWVQPRVSLLNIGSEEIKGRPEIKAAAELLANDQTINYTGFIEGDALFAGEAEIVVCDGFNGNVALKTAEGVARLLAVNLKNGLKKTVLGSVAGFLAKPTLEQLKARFSPSAHNGASFLGIKGVAVKSHGGADQQGFSCAILVAYKEAALELPRLIGDKLHN